MLVRSLDIAWVELVAAYPLLQFVAVAVGYVTAKLFGWRLDSSTITTWESEA